MMLEIVDGYSRDFKVKFGGDKSKVMVTNGDETDKDREWDIGEGKISRTKEHKYLGCMLSEDGCARAKGEKVVKAMQWWGRLSSVAKYRANKYECIRGIWKYVAIPSIMFGMNVMTLNGGDLEKLEVLQNRIEHLPLGAPKWIAAKALRGDLGWSLFSERMVKAVFNYKILEAKLGSQCCCCFRISRLLTLCHEFYFPHPVHHVQGKFQRQFSGVGRGHRGGGRGWFDGHESRGSEDSGRVRYGRGRRDGSGGRGGDRPPPHLKGREIGLWYRDRQKKGGSEKKVMASLSMDSQQAQSLDRVLNSIGTTSGSRGNDRTRGPHHDSFSSPDEWLSDQQQGQQQGATAYTRTIDGMRDSAFKRAYMDNVRANQLNDEVKQESTSDGLVHCSEQDAGLREDMLQLQETAKYKKMLEFRKRLPAYAMQEEILQLINHNQVRPDLKLVLMSATLNAEKFSEYYGGCPMVHIPGFTFPVTEYYLEDVLDMTRFEFPSPTFREMQRRNKNAPTEFFSNVVLPWIDTQEETGAISRSAARELRKPHSEELSSDLVVSLLRYICRQPPGAVLIFLPGWSDISSVNKLIDEDSALRSERLLVIPLHSLMPTANQREVFDRPPQGVRKVVLATNIAETSITIDDIVYVIDGGYIKMTNFDKTSNLSTLASEWVSKANARQRRGRAGRVQEGICYHLFSRIREEQLADYPLPEILRTRLEEIVLQVKILKLGKVQPFLLKLMEAPDQDVIAMSIKLLEAINALDEDENLTPLGFHLARLPVDPLTGRMLLMSSIFSCVDPVLTVAAVLSFKEPFVMPLGKEKLVDEVRARFAGNTFSDHLMYVRVFDAWREVRGNSNSFCYKNFLSPSVLQQIKRMRDQFFGLLKDHKFVAPEVRDGCDIKVNYNSGNVAVVRAIIASGLYPNVACLKRIDNQKSNRPSIMRTADHNRVLFHPKCVNDKARVFESPWMVFREKIKMSSVFLFDATNVPNYPLLLFGQNLKYVASEGAINVDDFVKIRCSIQVADVIRKLRRELDCLLEYKISHPEVTCWDPQSKEGKLLNAIVDLLSSEKVDPYQQCGARWDDEDEGQDEYQEEYPTYPR
ncbi:Helicase-associated domain [Trinorchestia longiramus]|nr:Helicase-associated domain [Trinorchestia longiramus]